MLGNDENVVATLSIDGKVYPTKKNAVGELVNLMNYKIRTERDMQFKTLCVPATVVDMGKQLLQYSRDGNKSGIQSLLSRGAPFTSDWLGMSALHFAAMNNHYEICDILLKGGINKDAKTKVDRTPLHLAVFYGHMRIVQLLLSKNCIVNTKDMLRMTPLHWAVEKKHKHIARLLLMHNAEVDCTSKFGRTPIGLAVASEQPDLLTELEAVRRSQAKQKFNEKHEKETSAAVNSIIHTEEIIDESTTMSQGDANSSDAYGTSINYTDFKFGGFENIKATDKKVFENNTINMPKGHGISLRKDDSDTSKALLNSALQNGRQLVLSEGGKLLLNDTLIIQNNNTNIKNNNLNNNKNIKNNNNIKSNNNADSNQQDVELSLPMHIQVIPPKVQTQTQTLTQISGAQLQKAPTKIALKGENGQKNVRIISMENFKKLYGDSMRQIPPSLANSRLAKQLNSPDSNTAVVNLTAANSLTKETQKVFIKQMHIQNGQVVKPATENTKRKDENLLSSGVMHIPTTPSSNVNSFLTNQQKQQITATSAALTTPTNAMGAIRVIPAKRLEQRQAIAPIARTAVAIPPLRQSRPNSINSANVLSSPNTSSESAAPNVPITLDAGRQNPIIATLTLPEICRQLFDLRKQNELLKRKFDLVYKEKEELRQRLDRIENLLLVDKFIIE